MAISGRKVLVLPLSISNVPSALTLFPSSTGLGVSQLRQESGTRPPKRRLHSARLQLTQL